MHSRRRASWHPEPRFWGKRLVFQIACVVHDKLNLQVINPADFFLADDFDSGFGKLSQECAIALKWASLECHAQGVNICEWYRSHPTPRVPRRKPIHPTLNTYT